MKKFVVVVSLLAVLTGVASANLLLNPGFEAGDLSSWTQGGWYTGMGGDAHSGSYGAARAIDSSIVGENYFVAEQFVPVTGGLFYDFSGWLRIAGTPNASESFLELRWLDAGSGSLGQFGTTPLAVAQDYTQYSLLGYQAPGAAVQARIALVVHTTGGAITDNSWHTFDDISFAQAIPEPASMTLMGLGALGLLGLRRRMRK